ncbi:MAG: N-6 DNA methylase [Armatimonadetes bacterium]|nr:N-6 DNA methylase [Armatimonadota bacterium]
MTINEWTITADIAKWIEEILKDHVELPFGRTEVEERAKGGRKRRDLTIYNREGKRVLTGEMKMPDSPEGSSPFRESLVIDAHDKADSIGAEYFFTWNINRCVLWRTFEQGKPITERHIAHFPVLPIPIRRSEEAEHPRVQDQIKKFLTEFLKQSAAIMSGAETLPTIPLDEKFLIIWEAALEQPVALTLRALIDKYNIDKPFTNELDKWMRSEQGWIISHSDENVIKDNLERASKFACYVLANKVVFYKALRRQFTKMRALKVPDDLCEGVELQALFNESFDHAKNASKDYETIFNGDFGDTIPFLSDAAVDSWRELVKQTDGFDFTKMDYEIIGQVFERMLSNDERHKFGQHYTRSEVVDLINTFCIRDANARVMDPSCGGGTFLVRAYSRKRDLSGGALKHEELLRQLYGVDISAYPAHLTTINLATRDLIDRANYPLVARKDFFDIQPGQPIFHVPLGSDDGQIAMLDIGKVDAIVGNPPYVRQEKIGEYYGQKYKDRLRDQSLRDAPGCLLSGRSDIHCYFFTHGFSFLEDGGYMGLLTSSTWLDTSYGFQLQRFLLDNFEILAVFESECEPWFTGARVTTAATILRRQPDPEKRAANTTKFVLLTKPIGDILAYSTSERDRHLTFEDLRQRVENATGTDDFTANLSGKEAMHISECEMEGMRIRIVNQGDLYKLGCTTIDVSGADEEDAEEEQVSKPKQTSKTPASMQVSAGNGYTGYKWGLFLRAPRIFFTLLKKGNGSFVPLAAIADAKRGVTSGCDTFFFPQDITDESLAQITDRAIFRDRYGITRHATERIRIVKAGDGTVHLIEKEYLEPVVFNLMEINSVVVDPDRLRKRILRVSTPKDRLRGTHVLKYIRWGESEGFSARLSCASRELWYCLTIPIPGDALWTMTQRYRYIVPANPKHLICNKRLFNIRAVDSLLSGPLSAILNSTLASLMRYCFGRIQGGDPVMETEVVDVKMMLVPDPRKASDEVRARLESALDSMAQREIGHLVAVDGTGDELSGDLAMADRQQLDDAVLEMIGIADPAERQELLGELYDEMTRLYRSIRTAEKKMQGFRSQTARKGRPSSRSIANEIWEAIESKPHYKTVLAFAATDDAEVLDLPEGKARVVQADLWNPPGVKIGRNYIPLEYSSRARFVKSLADDGIHGIVHIPNSPEHCQEALLEHTKYITALNDEFADLAADHTSDEQMQEKVVNELWRLIRNGYE